MIDRAGRVRIIRRILPVGLSDRITSNVVGVKWWIYG